jgi:hypothetical protein
MTKYVENECPAQLRYFPKRAGQRQLISKHQGSKLLPSGRYMVSFSSSIVSFTTGQILHDSQRVWCFPVHMQIDEPRKLSSPELDGSNHERSCGSKKYLTSVKSTELVGGVINVPDHGVDVGLVAVRFVPGARMQIAGFLASYHQPTTANVNAFSRNKGYLV